MTQVLDVLEASVGVEFLSVYKNQSSNLAEFRSEELYPLVEGRFNQPIFDHISEN